MPRALHFFTPYAALLAAAFAPAVQAETPGKTPLPAAAGAWDGPLPSPLIPAEDIARAFAAYDVILEPDRNEPEWWAGAPSVVKGPDGDFWLACRMRDAVSPRGLRGYELRILKSKDGAKFDKVRSLRREDVPVPGFERPALLIDPQTGLFKLYACCPWKGGPWTIIKFDDAATPGEIDPATARPVIAPLPKRDDRDVVPDEYKDPVVVFANGAYHCWVIGAMRRTERIFHFTSADGETWSPVGSPYESVMDLTGWHDFYVRPASVIPMGFGHLFVYEGSNVTWRDPVYNILTGLGITFDLNRVLDMTPDAPLLASATPGEGFATLRYSSWLWADDEIWIYVEAVRPNRSHEIRRFRLRTRGGAPAKSN